MSGLPRRSFLRASAAGLAGAAMGMPGCASTAGSGGGDYEVIDCHTHFYDPTRPQGVPWPPKGEKRLYRRVMPEDYLSHRLSRAVAGTVVVEASPWLQDNQWILDLAMKSSFIVGFVGNLRPGDPRFKADLERFSADPLFRGIRVRDRGLGDGAAWKDVVADLGRMADLDLSLDVNVPFRTLPDVERIAGEITRLRIIVNHVALARIDGKAVDDEWGRRVRSLAKHANVFMKVSGLVEATGRRDGTAPRDVEFYRPWLDVLWDAFGEDRLVYGSNWPVCDLYADLASVQGLAAGYFEGRGGAAARKVFRENSKAIYKWMERRVR